MYLINQDFNTIFKAIGYKTRTDILQEIARDENLCLTKLAKKFKMSKKTLEYHIKELKQAKIILTKRNKNEILLILNRQVLTKAFSHFNKIVNLIKV
ncbi:MAG: ArsR/SmtB family transcription factor [Alphaproteobacteria bacterium]